MATAATVTIEAIIMIQPANQATVLPGDLLRPLVDRAGDRIAGGELGEAERDGELAGEDEDPAPPERRPGEAEAEREELEHPGEDGDVREGRGER